MLSPDIKQDIEEKAEKLEKRETNKKYTELLTAYTDLKALTELEHEKINTGKIISRVNDKSKSVFFMIASDWHCAKRIVKSRVNGLNEFNIKIFNERSDNFFINSLTLLKQFEVNTQIEVICLALLGDFIENYIHEEQPENNTMLPLEELIYVQDKLATGIQYLLDNTNKKLYIPCLVGNHSRKTSKIHVSTEVKNSYEWVIYWNLKKFFANNDRVEFDIADGTMLYKKFYNYTIRFLHGTSIRYSGGVGGIFIAGNKAIAQWNKSRNADLTIFGHFHQTKYSGWGGFICNGSLCGYDEYALNIKADFERPQQSCFLLDKHRGLTIQAPILLDRN